MACLLALCSVLLPLAPYQQAVAQPDATGTSADARVPAGAEQLQRFIDNVSSLTAEFEQETWNVDQELVDRSSGTFALLRPGRFLWHYETPFELLVVADGANLWMYDVELEQVTRTPIDDLPGTNPAMLLSGERVLSEDFEVDRSYRVDNLDLLELSPKTEQSEFRRLLVAFDTDVPTAIEIVDGLNQTTRVEFAEVEVNVDVDPGLFEFEPPDNVSVIGGPQ